MIAIIVDDNKIARVTLNSWQLRYRISTFLANSTMQLDARNYLLKYPADLLLLDIEMPGMSGLDLSRNLANKHPLIIFTTSKREYAVEAFELNVVDYLVKPVKPARFIQAIDRVRIIFNNRIEEVSIQGDEFIFIRDTNVIRKLRLDDILFAETMGDYVKIYTENKFYAIHTSMRILEDRLPAGMFLRIHRSYLIAVSKMDYIQEGSVVIHGKPLPVGDAYRAVLNKRMNVL